MSVATERHETAVAEHEEIMTHSEAARFLKVSPRTLYEWVENRMVPFSRAGRLLRYKRSQLLEWLDRQGQTK